MFDISSKNITRYLKSGIKSLLENPKKAKDLSWATWILSFGQKLGSISVLHIQKQ